MVITLNLAKVTLNLANIKTFCFAGGIIAWLALGPNMGFGNEWQLDVNTATAVELMIMTTFLQNTKRRHRMYMHRCSAMLATIDQELEERLVTATNECQVGFTELYIKTACTHIGAAALHNCVSNSGLPGRLHRSDAAWTATLSGLCVKRLVTATNDCQVGFTKQMLLGHIVFRLCVPRLVLKHCTIACDDDADDVMR